jgi:phage shock protein A
MTPQELSRLDYEGASDMLLAYATDAKKFEKEIAALQAQSEAWKAKATMAQSQNMPELEQAALQQVSEFETKAQSLLQELSSIRLDIAQLREAIPIIKAKQRRVDPDQLLAELSMITGIEDTAESTQSSSDASSPQPSSSIDDALSELKKKMGIL